MSDNYAVIRQLTTPDEVTGEQVDTYPITCLDALVGRDGKPYKEELKKFVDDTIQAKGYGAINIADSIPEAGGSATKLLPTNADSYVLKVGGTNYMAHSVVFGDGDPFLAFCFLHTENGKGMGYALFELADSTHWKYKAYYTDDNVPAGLLKVFNEDLRTTIDSIGQKVGNLDQLTTTDKSSIVNALNEVAAQGGGGGSVDQIQSDWAQTDTTKKDYIKNKPTLASVATSGSYNDLQNKPTIPSTDGLETSEHASATYQPKGNYITDISGKVDTANVVNDTESTTYSVAVDNTQKGEKVYKLGTLSNLAITSVGSSEYETIIFFAAGASGCEVAITAPYDLVGEIDTSAEGEYVISILNGCVVCGTITNVTE